MAQQDADWYAQAVLPAAGVIRYAWDSFGQQPADHARLDTSTPPIDPSAALHLDWF